MSFQDEQIAEARANIARAEAENKARVDRLVKQASKETEVWAAEQALAARQAEQAQEAAQQARAAQKEADAREDAQRAYLSAGGLPADFDSWYVVERARLVTEKIASERRRAELSYRSSF
jgi:rubrerythrin